VLNPLAQAGLLRALTCTRIYWAAPSNRENGALLLDFAHLHVLGFNLGS